MQERYKSVSTAFDRLVQTTLTTSKVQPAPVDVADLALPCIIVGLVLKTSASAAREHSPS